MFTIFKAFYNFKVRIQTTMKNWAKSKASKWNRKKGHSYSKNLIQKVSFTSWVQCYPLLLRGNAFLEGTGDHWGLGFAPLAPLMCPAGVSKVILVPIFSHIHLSPRLVLCAPPPIQREVGSMEKVTPKHVLFSMPQLPIFYSPNISLKQQHLFGLWKESGR